MEPIGASLCFADARRIDRLCDDFEARWRSGQRPRLEEFVATLPEPLRRDGLGALLAIELELLSVLFHKGEKAPPHEEYLARFSEHQDLIARVLAQASEAARRETVAGESGTDLEDVQPWPAPKPSEPEPMPERVGRFEIVGLLGTGTQGRVYRARDPHLDREVAVKIPRALESNLDRHRFLREAKIAAQLRHPHICPVYEVGMDNHRLYVVMAFVEGATLAERIKALKVPMPAFEVAQLIRRLALALQTAHDKGIVHRDLKPGNILVGREGAELVITDFGLARLAQREESELQTQSGIIMGTPAYMAPEQARGDLRGIGPQSDIYALGVLLYELICGRRPFTGTVGEVIGQILHVEPVAPSSIRPGADRRLETICMKAMAKDPAARFRSMTELGEALGAWDDHREKENDGVYAKNLAIGGAAPESALSPMAALAVSTSPRSALDEGNAVPLNGHAALAAEKAHCTSHATTVDRRRIRFWLAGMALFASLLLGGILYTSLANRSTNGARLNGNEGQPSQTQEAASGVLLDKHKTDPQHPIASASDPGRAAAEFLLAGGAIVAGTAGGKEFSLNGVNAIGPGPVNIIYIGADPNGSSPLTDEMLALHAPGLTKLQRINGNDMKLKGTGFGAFRQSELKALDMHAGSITDAGLQAICTIPTIEELAFPKNAITDAGLSHLPNLPRLWNLDLRANKITDAGVAHLARCANLGDLGLDATGITDVGLDKLKGCSRLFSLHVQGTNVTKAAVLQLHEALPKCQLFTDFGTFDPKS